MPTSEVFKELSSAAHWDNDVKLRKEKSKKKKSVCIWNKKVPNTELEIFSKIVGEKRNLKFDSYRDIHKWSINHSDQFWEEVWNYFGVVSSKPYDEVMRRTGPGILDVEWFSGAEFNFAENVLRIRDERIAIIFADEEDQFEEVTFARLFEEVRLWAAAFRKHGLKKGDRVACYMSNRPEAVYAMLATISIGAIWGGPQPYFGAKAASNIISMMEPKFLVTVDRHQDDGIEYPLLDYLPTIAQNTPTVEKIIIVKSKPSAVLENISHIPNSCVVESFLERGRLPDGSVPVMSFEQLPFDHPITISFTSGTTGMPKGLVHGAGSLLCYFVDYAFHWNLKSGDTMFNMYTMGWTLWNLFVCSLSVGVRVYLWCGSPFHVNQNNKNMWDRIADNKVTWSFFVPSILDKLQKKDFKLSCNSNMDSFKMMTIGGCPVKTQNINYVLNNVKKDLFVGTIYGATESTGGLSGFDFNLPSYACECQLPALGKNIQAFDSQGCSLVGEIGEVVISNCNPSLPLYLWKDEGNRKMEATYLSKYPGVWLQNDECLINPETDGIVVKGRSDETLIQYGDRFTSNDIYLAIHDIEEVRDYICVSQTRDDGDTRAVLFVQTQEGVDFTTELKEQITQKITAELWFDCVPQLILPIPAIPYNQNKKRMERVVREIIGSNRIPDVLNIMNPECLEHFLNIREVIEWKRAAEL